MEIKTSLSDNYHEESNPNLGYYPEPGWEWQKPEPKTYLVEQDLAKYARGWILNLVELVHWLPFVPAFILSFLIFQHSSALKAILGTDIQVFLLAIAPIIQTFGGLTGIMMHEYEGWQVVHFKNPLDSDFDIKDFNNEWLREVAYKLLFVLQGAGLLAFSLGVFGINKITLTFAIVSGIVAFIGPQNPKATIYPIDNQPVFPLAVSILVVFIVNAIVNFVAYFHLFTPALAAANLPVVLAGLAPTLLMLGGVVEGILAESTFNQWWHFTAVIFLNLGIIVQIYFFQLLW
ncbi:hypothetical protein AY599_26560 [Leptolyngbya valderiana BDU 20041]|nr:hypothetical protein [Geitlerinema sp. CS-897]OAB61525.1 hypothetical protein AY599_26560 [Leptolyngbya valderiana BDU 20041]PPT06129.1 hypothetical protein CKA32_003730 [Geitlerinema sp. FC II]